jgi:pyrroline-5-carboxylate reductase
MRLGVIGYGKMGSSLVKGGLRSGLLKPQSVSVIEPDGERRDAARSDGLKTADSLADLAGCGAILISVKPKDFPRLLNQICSDLDPDKPLFISIAAGITLGKLEEGLGKGSRVARVMPNIPASVNEAASVYILNSQATARDRSFVRRFLTSVGKAYELEDEKSVDAVTGVSGSGPAYFFLLMGAMESAGVRAGLPKELARSLVTQTCRGAGTLALESGQSMAELIKAVASPGGTTEEALKVLESKGFSAAVAEAIVAAIEKSKSMSKR